MSEEVALYSLIHEYSTKKKKKPEAAIKTVVCEVKELPLRAKNWEEALEVYDNNQNLYLEAADQGAAALKLKALEKWFVELPEPKPDDKEEIPDWILREKQRKAGTSSFCDPEAKKLMSKVPSRKKNI